MNLKSISHLFRSSGTIRPSQNSRQCLLLVIFIPALLGLIAGAAFVYQYTTRKPVADIHPRRLSKADAEVMARRLCNRIAGNTVELVSTYNYESAPGIKNPMIWTWEVTCRAAGSLYTVEINAESSEVSLFRHEQELVPNSTVPEVERERIPHQEAYRNALGYLRLLGLPLPKNATQIADKPGYAFAFQCNLPGGRIRMLQVRINKFDGSLESLRNVVYRSINKQMQRPAAPI